MSRGVPLIGVTACLRTHDGHPAHVAGEKYIRAAALGAGGIAVLVPALGIEQDPLALAARLDGLLITGSPSNLHPGHYDGGEPFPGELTDPRRDATTLPLIRIAIATGLPVLGICRGLQELNVALGGSLHRRVFERELPPECARIDHRDPPDAAIEECYAPAHEVSFTSGGLLHRLTGQEGARVNSLHGQGIDRLAPGLTIEATAPDGLIEAVRVTDCAAFALAVQWHPEWRFESNAVSLAVLRAFGDSARARAASMLC